MGTGTGFVRSFVEPLPEPPRKLPLPRRRFAFGLLFPCAVTMGGGIVYIVHYWLKAPAHAVPKPGPRRYPPGYRQKAPERPAAP